MTVKKAVMYDMRSSGRQKPYILPWSEPLQAQRAAREEEKVPLSIG